MRLSTLQVENFRSFKSTDQLELSNINVFVGRNNSGKSSILRAIHLLQEGNEVTAEDIRIGERAAALFSYVGWGDQKPLPNVGPSRRFLSIRLSQDVLDSGYEIKFTSKSEEETRRPFPAMEPAHVIIPIYSHRKTKGFSGATSKTAAQTISGDFKNLAAKLTRIMNTTFSGHSRYVEICREVLGQEIFTILEEDGAVIGAYADGNKSVIPLKRMGDGVQHIIGLLVELLQAQGKIFLIEELENDLHPAALKALLDLIIEKSEVNQFFISTHSNVVVRHLCSERKSRLFHVSSEKSAGIPTSSVEPVAPSRHARIEVLRELGYTLSDFELAEGWLILEESSAERIIRDFLIPMFVPRLILLQTVAAGGVSKVGPIFEDFRRLALYSHLQAPYRDRTWVLVDGDEVGKKTVRDLCEAHKSWPSDRFATLSSPQFERYYPEVFWPEVDRVLSISGKEKRAEKAVLLKSVLKWLQDDSERARAALETSAAEVIKQLRKIDVCLHGLT